MFYVTTFRSTRLVRSISCWFRFPFHTCSPHRMALISSFISSSVIDVCAISLFRYIMQIYCMGISVQIPRQARDDRKETVRRTGRRLPIRAGRTGERAGGFYEKNQQRGTLTASAISRLTEMLRALNALMMVLIVRF